MAILSDKWIREKALSTGMIEPFVESQKRDGCISYGLSSYGYDARVADEFKIFTNVDSAVVDPKDFAANSFVDRKTDVCIIPPNSFALARTVEYFRVPRDVLVICLGKSTYARCGIIVNVTPLEPGWEGHVTLEFSNTTPLPAKIYANEGACQFLFLQGNEPCEVSYADRAGKYGAAGRHPAPPLIRRPPVLSRARRHGGSPRLDRFFLMTAPAGRQHGGNGDAPCSCPGLAQPGLLHRAARSGRPAGQGAQPAPSLRHPCPAARQRPAPRLDADRHPHPLSL